MRHVGFAFMLAGLAACASGGGDKSPERTVSRVEVTPAAPTVPAGTVARFHATAVYSDQSTLDVTELATWYSTAPAVLDVASAPAGKGSAQALTAGPAKITATYAGVSGSSNATVVVLTLLSIEVTPASATIAKGQVAQLGATAHYDDASTYDVTASATWTSDAELVATVSNASGTKGSVQGVGEGGATITASFGGQGGTSAVTVTPAVLEALRVEPLAPAIPVGVTQQLHAWGTYSDQSEADLTQLATWSVDPLGVVSVSTAGTRGVAQGIAAGSAVVTATYQARSGAATVTVRPASLVAIEVTPASPATVVGGTVQLHAVGTYDNGQVLDITTQVLWGTGNASVASVSNVASEAGMVTGIGVGSATVTASLGAVSRSVEVQVANIAVSAVRVEPDAVTVSPSRTVALRAFGNDASGLEVDVTGAVMWTSSANGVATVSGGVVSGVSTGTAIVTATLGSTSGSADVLVETPYVVALSILAEDSLSAGVGAEGALRVKGLFSDGSERDLTEIAAWVSDAPGVAAVSNAPGTKGVVRCIAPGTAHLSAAFAGLSASATLTVTARNVQWLVLSVPPSPLPIGVTQRVFATAVYDDWGTEDVSSVATWSASGAVAVDPQGVASTVAAGTGTVTASYGGVSGSTVFSVTGDAPTGLQLSLNQSSVAQGNFAWWTAYLTYPGYVTYTLDGGVELVSTNTAVADIFKVWDRDPVPRGLSPGQATIEARYAGLVASQVLTVTAATNVTITFPSAIPLGATVRASFDGSGDLTDEAHWSSSDETVLTVTNSTGANTAGFVTAVGTGTATLTATYGALTDSKTVTVKPRVATIEVTPAIAEIPRYDSYSGAGEQFFAASATLADGSTLDVTSMAEWSSDWAVAAPSYPGWIRATGLGRTIVTAAFGGGAGHAILTVSEAQPTSLAIQPYATTYRLPPGVTVKFRVQAVLAGGSYAYPTSGVTWTSSNPAAATFSADPAHEGELTTIGNGMTTIGATFGGATQVRTVVVDTPSSLVATPSTLSVPSGGTRSITAVATYPGPNTFDVAPFVTWSSDAPSVATATGGTVYGKQVGSTTLRTTFGTLNTSAMVTVTTPVVTSVAIADFGGDRFVGTRTPVVARAGLNNGDSVDVTALATWTADPSTIATVSGPPFEIEALATGTATLRAHYAGLVTPTASVRVIDTPPAGLTIVPPLVSLPVGGATYVWVETPASPYHVGTEAVVSSSNPAVAEATNGPSGVVVRAVATGTSVITATYRGVTAEALVQAYAAPGPLQVARGYLDGEGPIHVSERAHLVASASGPTGYVDWAQDVDVTTGATWTSSNTGVARVVQPGLVEGVAPGIALISASLAGTSAQMWVMVSSATLQRLDLSEFGVGLPVGAELPLHVYGVYSDGLSASLDHVATWQTDFPAYASFVAGEPGVLHGNSAGSASATASFGGFTARVPVAVFAPP